MAPKIFDKEGQERDWAWLIARFGDVTISQSTYEQVYRLVEIREQEGPAALIPSLLDEEGQPVPGVQVIRYWPGAPELPVWDPPPERWKNRGVHGKTNDEGHIGFGMGGGDYYDSQTETGASSIWVGELGWGSDCIHGLGMLAATNHIHLNPTFQRQEGGGNGNGEPPVEGDALERIAAALEYIASRWPFS